MEQALRKAVLSDLPALEHLIEASVRGLQAGDYTPAQIDAALQTAFTADRQLILDGTYSVVTRGDLLLGCGGWSWRRPLCGSSHHVHRDDMPLDPSTDAAKIRAIFVHPDFARQGLGSLLLKRAEDEAAAAGFKRCEMGATVTGLPLYLRAGYSIFEEMDVALRNGISMRVIRMVKTLNRS